MFLWQQQYHTNIWNEWSLLPGSQSNLYARCRHVLQFSLSSDKEYPEYWSVQNAISTWEHTLKFKEIPISNYCHEL